MAFWNFFIDGYIPYWFRETGIFLVRRHVGLAAQLFR
jgi:hypothetical protein